MIELRDNKLIFSFPDVHEDARCTIDFQRTLRIPDDNREYPLPPGLGRFPVHHVDDYKDALPATWKAHGGVFIPMYQSEALWINFSGSYPCAVKIAAGKINAVSGKGWANGLSRNPQDYAVIPEQPWLDGFNVSKDHIRQFVAMPLGEGFTAEEQLTGSVEYGGLQIIAYPMKREFYLRYQAEKHTVVKRSFLVNECHSIEMGLAPGGLMRQKIYEDKYGMEAWDLENGYRCFVHLANSTMYKKITGHRPPHTPVGSKQYTDAGLPWFEYYSDEKCLHGSEALAGLKSVAAKIIEKDKIPMLDNEPASPTLVKRLGDNKYVRDGDF